MDKVIFNIEPYSFTVSAVVVGLLLTNELSTLEQDSFGNWLQLVGLVIQTYGSQVATLAINNEISNDDIESLKESIKNLETELEKIKKPN